MFFTNYLFASLRIRLNPNRYSLGLNPLGYKHQDFPARKIKLHRSRIFPRGLWHCKQLQSAQSRYEISARNNRFMLIKKRQRPN